jgi:hypothetical protein
LIACVKSGVVQAEFFSGGGVIEVELISGGTALTNFWVTESFFLFSFVDSDSRDVALVSEI